MSTRIAHRIIHASRHWRPGRYFKRRPVPGKRIHHDIFGAGTVKYHDPWGWTMFEFDAHGQKAMHAKFYIGKVASLVALPTNHAGRGDQ